MALDAVDNLSDDDGCNHATSSGLNKPRGKPLSCPRTGFKRKLSQTTESTSDPLKLRRLVSGKCGCLCGCFKPFQGSIHLFEDFVKHRKFMDQMTKLEKDQHVMT